MLLRFSFILAFVLSSPVTAQTLSGGGFTTSSGVSSSSNGSQVLGVVAGGALGVSSGNGSSQLQSGPLGAATSAQGAANGNPSDQLGQPTGGGGGGGGGCDFGGPQGSFPWLFLSWSLLLLRTKLRPYPAKEQP